MRVLTHYTFQQDNDAKHKLEQTMDCVEVCDITIGQI